MTDREYWVDALVRLAGPVLTHLANRELKKVMPVEGAPSRGQFTHLEALGRTLAGIAPWLEAELPGDSEEERLRRRFAALAREALDAGTDPDSPDFLNFRGNQPIVDAAFLAQGILRARRELWERLDDRVRRNIVECLKQTRRRKPLFNNWLLFSATIEAALYVIGEEWDPMRIDYALRQHEQWYVGDGTYSDGPRFHWDYYNSFVIQPMLVDTILTVGDAFRDWAGMKESILARARRFAAVLERMISPEGTYPIIGRSIAYRFAAFQLLGQMALMRMLPDELPPSQVRAAMTAVIRRALEAPGTFDDGGWLRIGVCGSQPEIAEGYISTGSLYLCTTALLPLGLPPADPFWSDPPLPWTSKRVWSGERAPRDKAVD